VTLVTTTVKAICVATPLMLAYGCSSFGSSSSSGPDRTEQAMTAAQSALAEAKAARSTAEAALAEARTANAKLDQLLAQSRGAPMSDDTLQRALDAANAAQAAADDARRTAMQAQQAVDRLDTKTDRMFEKSMRK